MRSRIPSRFGASGSGTRIPRRRCCASHGTASVPEDLPVDLRTKAIRSTAWYGGTRLVTQLLSWGTTLVLARLLTPVDYGLFAMSYAVIAFLELFQEFGLGVAIIQRKNLTSRQVNSVFWLLMG